MIKGLNGRQINKNIVYKIIESKKKLSYICIIIIQYYVKIQSITDIT